MSNLQRKSVKIAFVIIGALLFAYFAGKTGWQRIADTIHDHALLLIALIVVFTLYHFLRTFTLQLCIPAKTNFWHVFNFRLAGEAFAYLTIGTIAGEFVKIAMARDKLSVSDAATGIFAEKLIYALSGAAFIISGLFAAVFIFGKNVLILSAISVLTVGFITLLYLMSSGIRPFTSLLKRYQNKAFFQTLIRTEESLFRFRSLYPKKFLAVFLLDFVSFFYPVLEAGFIFGALGYEINFVQLWYLQAVLKIANTANMILPANLGLFEAAHAMVTKQLMMGEAAGILVAIIVRIRAIAWSLIGYLVFVYLLQKRKYNQPL
jgi:lysylphosphatidylglycerol synthase-like protein